MGQVITRVPRQLEDRQLTQTIGSQLILEPIKIRLQRQPHQFRTQAIHQAQRRLALEFGSQAPLQIADRHQPQGKTGLLHEQAVAMAVDQPGQGG
jgi:hypothetical protein